MDEVIAWLRGSDWHFDMYTCDHELIKEFGVVNVDRYWAYDIIYKAVSKRATQMEHACVLEMLKYVRESDWALSIQDYYYDIEDQFGLKVAKTFSVDAIIRSLE